MPKKIKLNLKQLNVSSFKTTSKFNGGKNETIPCGSGFNYCDNWETSPEAGCIVFVTSPAHCTVPSAHMSECCGM